MHLPSRFRYPLLASAGIALMFAFVLAFALGARAFAGLEFAQDGCVKKGMHVDRRTGLCKDECPRGQHWDSLNGCAYPYQEGASCPAGSFPAPAAPDAASGSVCVPLEIPPQ